MESIRIRNLRSLVDTGEVQIKPITVLVGANSSGKSTFLRAFPLLRQSVDVRTRGPLLWYGQYVDFGNFADALARAAEESAIGLEFSFETNYYNITPYRPRPSILDVTLNLTLVGERDKDEATRVEKCDLRIWDTMIKITYGGDSKIATLHINGHNFTDLAHSYLTRNIVRGLIPIPSPERGFRVRGNSVYSDDNPFRSRLLYLISTVVHGSTGDTTKSLLLEKLTIGSTEDMLANMQDQSLEPATWSRNTAEWTTSTQTFIDIRDLLFAYQVHAILESCNDYLLDMARNIRYSTPIRATAERYYRLQGLAIDEVDPRGQNLPMVLRNLTASQLGRFNAWLMEVFGFSVRVHGEGGHVSVTILEQGAREADNLTDMGFGYSQLLPVITQLWFLIDRVGVRPPGFFPRQAPILFAIEQPELHLHPRYQAKLADALIAAIHLAEERETDLRLVIETHSETIVHRFGHHIAQQRISADKINLVVFEKPTPAAPTTVTCGGYDEEGYLTNWPYGFFEPDEL